MNSVAQTGSSGSTSTTSTSPASEAASIAAAHGGINNLDMTALASDVAGRQQQDPQGATKVVAELEGMMTPVQRGEFAAALDGAGAANDNATALATAAGQTFEIGHPDAPAVVDWGSQPDGSSYRTAWNDTAARIGSNDPAAVTAALETELYGAPLSASAAAGQGPDPVQLGLDLTQMGLDIAGIFEPTPFADGSNALISLGRSIGSAVSGEWGSAGGHLLNAGISTVGVLPGLGDLAKAGKIGKWAQTVADSVSAIAHNPALRESLEPGLRAIADAVDKIPQGALDALPADARASIEGMKRQLDEFFGAGSSTGTRAADDVAEQAADVPVYRGTVGGKPVELPHVDSVNVNYVKRDRAEYTQLRKDFDNGTRADFARDLVSTPEGIAAAKRAGLDDTAIARLQDGKIPQGYQVHHKLPLDDGGTNDFDNLVLIQNSPYHTALTNAQRELVGDLPVGGSREVDFPVPQGNIYPAQK
ncbi:hypothetical protein [Novosphingobium gossypii]|uniref:hypothetical protein n=1 Tax=Novosphingobium gossypii TaxID=1604774 RepID=UPI003D1EB717